MGRIAAACLALALFAPPAIGCINDVELPAHEREFRSQYARSGRSAAIPAPSPYPARNAVLIGSGSTLLACGLAVVLFGGRSRG